MKAPRLILLSLCLALFIPTGAGAKDVKQRDQVSKDCPNVLEKSQRKKSLRTKNKIKPKTVTDSQKAFAAYAHSLLARESKGNNFAFSPFSIHTGLSMVYAGAEARTSKQIACALQSASIRPARLHAAQRTRLNQLAGVNQAGVDFSVANGLWSERSFSLRQPFTDLLTANYNAEIKAVDFINNSAFALEDINRWISGNTRDLIPDFLTPDDVNKNARLVLANAVAMKGEWLDKFKKEQTRSGRFHAPSGNLQVPMMRQSASYGYKKRQRYTTVELPYKGDRLSMYVVLPAKGATLDLTLNLTPEKLQDVTRGVKRQKVALAMPRFELDSYHDLKPLLKQLGMRDAFSERDADFSSMFSNDNKIFIGVAKHKAVIKLDEEGTEAAAVTVLGGMGVSDSPPIPAVVVDRPFLFLVRDKTSDTILFQGWVSRP